MFTKQNIPNLLTFARVLAVPVALGLAVFLPGYVHVLLWLFVAASLTDFLDGYLARKWNVTSALGTFLDPVADKLLVAVVLLYLVKYTVAPLLAIGLIIAREIYIAGLREFLALRSIPLPVSKGGKWKTALQLLAITLALFGMAYQVQPVWNAGMVVLWIAAALAVISAAQYTRAAIKQLR